MRSRRHVLSLVQNATRCVGADVAALNEIVDSLDRAYDICDDDEDLITLEWLYDMGGGHKYDDDFVMFNQNGVADVKFGLIWVDEEWALDVFLLGECGHDGSDWEVEFQCTIACVNRRGELRRIFNSLRVQYRGYWDERITN